MRFRERLFVSARRLAVVSTGLAVLFTCSVIVRGQSGATTALRPGIVIDPTGNVAYVMTSEGVAAIDLATGAKRWTSSAAAKPLAITGNRLISQVQPTTRTNRLELAVLDTSQRGAVAVRSTAELPSSVRVAVGETLDGKFETEARLVGNSAVVAWRFDHQPLRGIVEDPEGSETNVTAEAQRVGTQRSLEGAVQVDLTTGAVSPSDANFTADVSAQKRWILSANEVIAGAAPTQYESADGRHVVASERIADDRTWAKYRWTIFERAGNRRIGEFQTHLAFTPFVVRDSTLIYETTPYIVAGRSEPAKLRGISLANGQEAWSVEVRELVYRGPFPP
ncbi:MAG TPA: hypothetical protein VLB46_01040 [Pyrinomonadaceae bacterium]|nr:hypothetical protein [Pyrinomonadaceae bacterium]